MNRYLRSTPAALFIVLSLALIFSAGCGKDETPTDTVIPSVIDVSRIICRPLAPPPDTIATLAVRVEGEGSAATYQWKVEAGRLIPDAILNSQGDTTGLDSTSITIRWKVPAEAGKYMVTVRASTGSEVSADTAWVMVRRCVAMDAGLKYAFYPNLVEGELYCVGTNNNLTDRSFLGYHAYKLDNMPPTWIDSIVATPPLVPIDINGGFDFQFYPNGLLAASITDGAEHIRLQPFNVIFYPYFAARNTYWSKNEAAGTTYRRNRNLHPSAASSSINMVVWQRTVVGSTDDGKKDLVNIRFRNSSAPTAPIQTLTTAKDSVFQYGAWVYTYFRNIKPMFSPAGDAIIYFNDSTKTFEPCIIPMDGILPNLAERRALMADDKHGIFYYATLGGARVGVKVSEKTIFQWNPVNPTELAFIDDELKFCVFNYVTETVTIIGTGISEFVYSDDGKIAGVAADGIYVLEPGQPVAKRVFAKERATDEVIGINWSPGTAHQRLGFRMVRKGASTVESYSVLILYSVDDGRWYYASPEIKPVMGTEPEVNYTWMRAIFDPFTDIMYVPVPLSEAGGKSVLYYSR